VHSGLRLAAVPGSGVPNGDPRQQYLNPDKPTPKGRARRHRQRPWKAHRSGLGALPKTRSPTVLGGRREAAAGPTTAQTGRLHTIAEARTRSTTPATSNDLIAKVPRRCSTLKPPPPGRSSSGSTNLNNNRHADRRQGIRNSKEVLTNAAPTLDTAQRRAGGVPRILRKDTDEFEVRPPAAAAYRPNRAGAGVIAAGQFVAQTTTLAFPGGPTSTSAWRSKPAPALPDPVFVPCVRNGASSRHSIAAACGPTPTADSAGSDSETPLRGATHIPCVDVSGQGRPQPPRMPAAGNPTNRRAPTPGTATPTNPDLPGPGGAPAINRLKPGYVIPAPTNRPGTEPLARGSLPGTPPPVQRPGPSAPGSAAPNATDSSPNHAPTPRNGRPGAMLPDPLR